jgi:hypothetical protein
MYEINFIIQQNGTKVLTFLSNFNLTYHNCSCCEFENILLGFVAGLLSETRVLA